MIKLQWKKWNNEWPKLQIIKMPIFRIFQNVCLFIEINSAHLPNVVFLQRKLTIYVETLLYWRNWSLWWSWAGYKIEKDFRYKESENHVLGPVQNQTNKFYYSTMGVYPNILVFRFKPVPCRWLVNLDAANWMDIVHQIFFFCVFYWHWTSYHTRFLFRCFPINWTNTLDVVEISQLYSQVLVFRYEAETITKIESQNIGCTRNMYNFQLESGDSGMMPGQVMQRGKQWHFYK